MNPTAEFLHFVSQSGDILESKIIYKDVGILGGHYDDMDALAQDALSMDANDEPCEGAWPANYIGLNPIRRDAAKRRLNNSWTLKYAAKDKDIACRNLILIDIDPERPSNTSSTSAEKAAAHTVALQVSIYLRNEGWPDPIWVDSGNGYHLLYNGRGIGILQPIDYAIKSLAKLFDTPAAKVDTSVHTPAHTARLPGSMNRKGPNTPERPHRRCSVISYPDKWEPVDNGMIYRLAAYSMPSRGRRRDLNERELLIDHEGVLEFIEEFEDVLTLDRVSERGEDTYYALAEWPFKGSAHQGQSGGYGKTCIVLKPGVIGFKCFSSDCSDHTFGSLLELLEEQTGRVPSMEFYASSTSDEDLEEMWEQAGVVLIEDDEIVSIEEEVMEPANGVITDPKIYTYDWFSYLDRYILRDDAADAEAAQIFVDSDLASAPTDPALWGLTWDEVRDPYLTVALDRLGIPYDEAIDIDDRKDTAAACALLGTRRLYDMVRLADSGRIWTFECVSTPYWEALREAEAPEFARRWAETLDNWERIAMAAD